MNKVFTTDDPELKITCRIPFTAYFLGKELWRYVPKVKGRGGKKHWSPFYLYRKEFDGSIYVFIRI